jgi:hypothetical protein
MADPERCQNQNTSVATLRLIPGLTMRSKNHETILTLSLPSMTGSAKEAGNR